LKTENAIEIEQLNRFAISMPSGSLGETTGCGQDTTIATKVQQCAV
jgi:hypothetical protein